MKDTFDRKFGPDLVANLPTSPAVYRFTNAAGEVVYVGKAKNIRRRLGNYRNASRRKAHRKMRRVIKAATAIEVELMPSEEAALLRENTLIRELRPPLNVDGAFAFLYPAIGLAHGERATLFGFTTDVDAYETIGLRWFGSFRSRTRAKEAFTACIDLLSGLGHVEPRSALPAHPRLRGSRLVGIRRLDPDLTHAVEALFAGVDNAALKLIARQLLDKPAARREAKQVQENLELLASFYQSDIVPLRLAHDKCGRVPGFVTQEQRDALFIRARATER